MTVVDTGPLVAILDADDQWHEACVAVVKSLGTERLLTTWPVLTEAFHFLQGAAREPLWAMLETGAIDVEDLSRTDQLRMHELMARYGDLPMDLADASLVAVSERRRIRRVFTVDHRDFSVYRPRHVRTFELVPAPTRR